MTPKLSAGNKPKVQVPINIRIASYNELVALCERRGWPSISYAVNLAIEEFLIKRAENLAIEEFLLKGKVK